MPHGYKTCKSCGEVVKGPRTPECPKCHAVFTKKAKAGPPVTTETAEPGTIVKRFYRLPDGYDVPKTGKMRFIKTPAGLPPVPLKSEAEFPSDDELLDWATAVRQTLISDNFYLDNSGLIYWAKQTLNKELKYKPEGDEMEYLGMILNELPDVKWTNKTVPVGT